METIIDKWCRWQRGEGHSPNSIKERRRLLLMFGRRLNLDPRVAAPDDIVEFLARCRDADMSKNSIASYFSHLKCFYSWLVFTDRRVDNPCDKVKAPKYPRGKPRPISNAQMGAVLATRVYTRTRMMILLAAFQGFRVHEIAKIHGRDVDLINAVMLLRGKGEVVREVPLHAAVLAIAHRMPANSWWFPTLGNRFDDGPIRSKAVSCTVGAAMRRAGVTGGAHRLRHWYATELVAGGINIRVVQELMRHASLQSTQIYTEISLEQQRAALAVLSMPVYALASTMPMAVGVAAA